MADIFVRVLSPVTEDLEIRQEQLNSCASSEKTEEILRKQPIGKREYRSCKKVGTPVKLLLITMNSSVTKNAKLDILIFSLKLLFLVAIDVGQT